MSQQYKITILCGSGAEGSGPALRPAAAGHAVTIGSRNADKAQAAAAEFSALLDEKTIHGTDNRAVAAGAETVILTVPGQRSLVEEVLAELRSKILLDATAPLVPPKVSRVQLPEGSSAVAEIQALAGDAVKVVSAFQNVSARDLPTIAMCECAATSRLHGPAQHLHGVDLQLHGSRGADLDPDRYQPPL